MTEEKWEAFQKIEDILSRVIYLSEMVEDMHYDPEEIPDGSLDKICQLDLLIDQARIIAEELSENCER